MATTAIDLSSYQVGWFTVRATSDASAGTLTKITIPKRLDAVRVTAEDGDLQITHTGTHNGAIGTAYVTVFEEGTLPVFNQGGDDWYIYLTGATNSVAYSLDPILKAT